MPQDSNIRVRIAPSPTGEVHIGSIWMALIDWLFVKKQNGKFVLRLEDTDQKRLVPGSIEKIYEALDWFGLTPDEGPKQGGEYGPYIQSQRLDIYRKHAEKLVSTGSAYYCFCTAERLDQLRQEQATHKLPPRYDKHCATLDKKEVARRLSAGESHVIRLNMPDSGSVTLNDLIRGQVTFNYAQIDDSVLLKSDGWPTYHLAVVIDDHLMEISHVIRGEEWLSSAPKHLRLYECSGWEPPKFAHLPLILGTDKKKLSKRDGSTSALSFRDEGYLPETMINFMALMGWHPKGEKEILSRSEILEQFNLTDINPSGAVFDRTKLDWMNGHYLRAIRPNELLEKVRPFWNVPNDKMVNDAWLMKALMLIRERMKTLRDVNEINTVFTSTWNAEREKLNLDLLVPKKGTMEATKHHLQQTAIWLEKYDGQWDAAELKENMIAVIADMGKKNGEILWPLRVALSLQTASPDVFDLLVLLGKDESLRRLRRLF